MKLDTLAEIDMRFVKDLPVEIQVKVILQVDSIVQSSSNAKEGTSELLLVAPDGDFAAFEVAKTCSMVGMKVTKDDGLDIGDIVAGRLDRIDQVVLFFVNNPVAEAASPWSEQGHTKDLQHIVDRTGHLRPVLRLMAQYMMVQSSKDRKLPLHRQSRTRSSRPKDAQSGHSTLGGFGAC